MMSHHARTSVAGAVALLAACATGFPTERGRQLEERVERIENEGPSPRSDADRGAARDQAQRVDARIAALESKLAEAAATAQRAHDGQAGAADRGAQFAHLAEELARVRKQLDEQSRKIEAIDRTVARLQTDVAQRPPGVPPKRASRAGAERPRVGSAALTPTPTPPPEAPDAGGRAEVLALAREQESKGQRAVARDLYEEYVSKFPSDPGTAEARFRLGELAFAERRYQDAIVEFGKVAQDFARSERAPDALLRTADSMLAIGLNDDAKAVLSEVPRRYPNSAAAARARQRLTQLGEQEKR
jgi:tol-pal system protein YbgF